ncbi:MAG TPA: type II toxin-antitoxin system HigB family toxin [Chitinophagaceae bacterium]|nr:type II toxin-antitoxin system HigB family toxin [Chitinophagaceae bacterium]
MKVHLIRKESIETYSVRHAPSRRSFNEWLLKIKYADWKIPEDIQMTFGATDLLGNSSNRVIFNIGGNNYRMICKYWFGKTKVHLYIKWIGSHAEYDALCKDGRQYTIDSF